MADHSEKRDRSDVTILFVRGSVALERLAACWAEDCNQLILRRCPVCGRRRSSGTVVAASKRTTSITIRSGFAGAVVSDAGGPSPPCRCFLFLTRITACWLLASLACQGRASLGSESVLFRRSSDGLWDFRDMTRGSHRHRGRVARRNDCSFPWAFVRR